MNAILTPMHLSSSSISTTSILLLVTTTAAVQAAPIGHLAYVRNGHAVVTNAAGGREKFLPKSSGTQSLAISSRGDVVYFVKPAARQKVAAGSVPNTAYLARPPYAAARVLPMNLKGSEPFRLNWSRSGTTVWLNGEQVSGAYTPATNNFKKLIKLPESVSANGRLIAYSSEDDIRVREVNSGRERIIFSRKNPAPLLAALKNVKNPKKLSDLTGELDPTLSKDAMNWAISSPALAPDGSRLYFTCNAGTGQGAAGNATFAFFSADLKTGKISALSTVGAQFGRTPEFFEVSPDGKRLLAVISAHSSAIDNPCYALVIDLLTQKSREILSNVSEAKNKSNMTYGTAWSPDSKYVAISAYFYDLDKLNTQDWSKLDGPADKDFTLYIKSATTGATVRRIPGAIQPSWGR